MPVKKTKTAPRVAGAGAARDAAPPKLKPGQSGGDAQSAAVAVPQQTAVPDQLSFYEAGMRHFHTGKYREARDLLLQSLVGPERDIAHRAELHIRMCDRRLEAPKPVLHSAEEHYNYGVALLNSRDLTSARHHLQIALALDPGADHVHYALAICYALTGDLQGSYENLKRAIEIQPRNRIAARQDADFAPFTHQHPFDRLLYPDRK